MIIAPLPASSTKWQTDEANWMLEGQNNLEQARSFALVADGGLVELHEKEIRYTQTNAVLSAASSELPKLGKSVKWEEWCGGMDGLGVIVMLAASLIP